MCQEVQDKLTEQAFTNRIVIYWDKTLIKKYAKGAKSNVITSKVYEKIKIKQ